MPQLSDESMQEKRSRTRFTDRIEALKWIAEPIATDIGEDLMVRVMNGRTFSGITFFVQLKSRAKLSTKERAQMTCIQKLDIAHLEHWERSIVPVVLVVWDDSTSAGYWIDIASAIRELERRNPTFRRQKYANVFVPLANDLGT